MIKVKTEQEETNLKLKLKKARVARIISYVPAPPVSELSQSDSTGLESQRHETQHKALNKAVVKSQRKKLRKKQQN